jgi:ferrous iron transport protein B
VEVIDLPGTYSLVSRSPDETVACEVLRGLRADTPAPDAVIVVVDGSNLSRNLYLVSQLIELGRPMVVALTMMDVAERRGLHISPARLEKLLGVPVVGLVGHKGKGVDELLRRLPEARVAGLPEFDLPEAMREELMLVAGGLAIQDESRSLDRCKAIAERLLIGDRGRDLGDVLGRPEIQTLVKHADQRLKQLAIDPMQADIEAHYKWIDEVASGAIEPACERLSLPATEPLAASPRDAVGEVGAEGRAGGAGRAGAAAGIGGAEGRVRRTGGATGGGTLNYARRVPFTDRLDRVLIHRVWGLVIFAGVMAALFVSIFSLAKPVMDATQGLVDYLGSLVAGRMPEGPIKDLWADGIVHGVGAVVVFVPQIAILFGFLAVLEDSGYLARAAFLMDRLLSKVGLSGKAFIPLLSSFACAIPGIMATRTIESRRQRLATILVAPFMSCSARLPVYTLLIGTFFAQWGSLAQAGVMLGLYLLGIVVAVATAWGLQRFGPKDYAGAGGFILELPTYKLPQFKEVGRQVWRNTTAFVTKAGTTIFCLSVVLWAMTYYPRLGEPEKGAIAAKYEASFKEQMAGATREPTATVRVIDRIDDVFPPNAPRRPNEIIVNRMLDHVEKDTAAAQLRHSIAGRVGHVMEPLIRPLGYDWKMGVGLVSAFAAREVFVSTMGIVYSAGDTEESTESLSEAMRSDRYADGRPVWTVPVALSLLVWFVLAMQCMSTLAIVRRETGSWRWPIVMTLYMNSVAYVAALVVYQVLSRLMV